jgi:hypothetical protein
VLKVILNHVSFVVVVDHPARPRAQAMDVVFTTPTVCPQMEEAGVGVPFYDVRNTRALFLSSFLYHQPTQNTLFKLCS